MNIEDIENFTLEQLASLIDDNNTTHALLASNELDRRKRIQQHELDLKLIEKQVKWMKFSVCAIIVAAIISGIVGYYLATLENKSRDSQLQFLQKLIQENISYKKGKVDHKEITE